MGERKLVLNFVSTKDQLIDTINVCEENTFFGLRYRVTSFNREQDEVMITNYCRSLAKLLSFQHVSRR